MASENQEPADRRVLVLANPYSGRKDNRRRVEALEHALRDANLPRRVVWDAAERSELLADPDAMADCRCVVAAGGDGTVAAAINELMGGIEEARPPLAVLPLGGENLFATHLDFDGDPRRLAWAIAGGAVRRIDLGCANGRWFSLMVSAGLDSEVVRRLAAWRSRSAASGEEGGGASLRRIKRTSYARPLVGALLQYDYPQLLLEVDGQTHRGAHVFVFNIGLYGPKWRLAPAARVDSGLLEWIVLEHPGPVWALRYIIRAARGRLTQGPGVRSGRAGVLRILAEKGTAPVAQVDGDPFEECPVIVRAVAGALAVVDMVGGSAVVG